MNNNEDLIGQKFNRLTVIGKEYKQYSSSKKVIWICKCICGNQTKNFTTDLKKGKSKSCGCFRDDKNVERTLDLTGKTFGALTVIRKAERINEYTAWLCKCKCGKEVSYKTISLNFGEVTSCGCRIAKFKDQDPIKSSAKFIYNNRYDDGDITFEKFFELSQKNCHYCGISPVNEINKFNFDSSTKNRKREAFFSDNEFKFIYNGLDRLDSNGKHTLDNVVTCCKHCNRAKLTRSVDKFNNWKDKIYNYWIIENKERSYDKEIEKNIAEFRKK